MQSHTTLAEIKQRAEAIGLSLSALAELAGVSPSTALRGLAGKNECRRSTERKLLLALIAREQAMREHLARLSPAMETAA